MTDLIKEEIDPSSARLFARIRNREIDLDRHITAFRREMIDVGVDENALFILFGRRVTRLFQTYLAGTYRNHVGCPHYSMHGKGYSDAEWVAKTWRLLEEHSRHAATHFNPPPFTVTEAMRIDLEMLRKRRQKRDPASAC